MCGIAGFIHPSTPEAEARARLAGMRAGLARKIAEPIDRLKKGFALPLSRWLRSELRAQVEETIFSKRSVCLATLDRTCLRRAWDDYQARQWDGALVFYSRWLYEAWHRTLTTAPAVVAHAR